MNEQNNNSQEQVTNNITTAPEVLSENPNTIPVIAETSSTSIANTNSQVEKKKKGKGVIIVVIIIVFLIAFIGIVIGLLLTNKGESNVIKDNGLENVVDNSKEKEEEKENTPSNNGTPSKEATIEDAIAINNYGNLTNDISLKFENFEKEEVPEGMHSTYYYLNVKLKNESNKDVELYSSESLAFGTFDAYFVLAGEDIKSKTKDDMILKTCRLKEISDKDGNVVAITLDTKTVSIKAKEELDAKISCSTSSEYNYTDGVRPAYLRFWNLENRNYSAIFALQ